jgi:hypothetical protein
LHKQAFRKYAQKQHNQRGNSGKLNYVILQKITGEGAIIVNLHLWTASGSRMNKKRSRREL